MAFAREGASVVVAGGRSAEAVAAEIRAEGGKAIDVPLDVTVPEEVQEAIEIAVKTFKTGLIFSSITPGFSVGSRCLK